jgi:hypothetical protein
MLSPISVPQAGPVALWAWPSCGQSQQAPIKARALEEDLEEEEGYVNVWFLGLWSGRAALS